MAYTAVVVVLLTVSSAALYICSADGSMKSCVVFHGADFSNQTLLIRQVTKEQQYCRINKTAKIGHPVPCSYNATATLLNATCVSLQVPEGLNVSFCLEHGRDNERGQTLFASSKACPISPDVTAPSVPLETWVIPTIIGIVGVGVAVLAAGIIMCRNRMGRTITFRYSAADKTNSLSASL